MAERNCDCLIVGNSAAGVNAATAYLSAKPSDRVIVVGLEDRPAYGRPLISYMLEGKTSEELMGYGENGSEELLLGAEYEVVSLDAEKHEASLTNGDTVRYRVCLVCTGSVPFVPWIDGMDEVKDRCSFLTVEDALRAREAASAANERAHAEGRSGRIAVIGGGLIGLKAAESLVSYVDEVHVFELAPRMLPAVLDQKGSSLLQSSLESHGVYCHPGLSVSRVLTEDGFVRKLSLTDGAEFTCDAIVLAVGVRPNTALLEKAGAEIGKGVVVDGSLRTSLPDVFAAGDVTQVADSLSGAKRPLALWPIAVRQGRLAGLRMAGVEEGADFESAFAVNAVDFFDCSLLTAGLINPAAEDDCEETVRVDGRSYEKRVVRNGRLVGYILLNCPDGAGVLSSLVESGAVLADLDEACLENRWFNLAFDEDRRWARLHKGYPEFMDRLGRKER